MSTRSGARCDIDVIYKTGESTADGLRNKRANASSDVSWSWTVGTNTTPGRWPVRVTCNKNGQNDSDSKRIRVTR